VLRRSGARPPLHLARALLRHPHLSLRERLRAGRAALALGHAARDDSRTLGDWLREHGQSAHAIATLWDLIALPTLNLPAAEASLALGAFVFRRGLLSSAEDGDIGFHVGTLREVIGDPAERALGDAGVAVWKGFRVEEVVRSGARLRVRGRGGRDAAGEEQELEAEAVVVAIPHNRAAALLEPLLGEAARRLRGLGSSPIVNLHVLYDRTVCAEPFAAGVGTPVQYLFDRTEAAGAPRGSQYLAVSLSGARREMAMSVEELRERYLPALAELLPRARSATVESFLVTREHAATFRAAPGVGALRPGAETSVPGLLLAGAWTDTGWPATLEGAVLSGHAAAGAALARLGLAAGDRPDAQPSVRPPAALAARGEPVR
jgi:squalene-associated FAD-dependent desaturase